MMDHTLFLGCNIPARAPEYEQSARAVLDALGMGIINVPEFNCCGYPMRNQDQGAFLSSSARNLALAAQTGNDLLVLCKCCFGALKHAQHILDSDQAAREQTNGFLAELGLVYEPGLKITHLFSVLHEGMDAIQNAVQKPLKGLQVAAHYGCHALRPSTITQFADPINPTIFEDLLSAAGATPVDWSARLDCCGAPAMGVADEISLTLVEKKYASAEKSGARVISTGCPYCQLQFDAASPNTNGNKPLAVLYPQLLGLAMGLDEKDLGLKDNRLALLINQGDLNGGE